MRERATGGTRFRAAAMLAVLVLVLGLSCLTAGPALAAGGSSGSSVGSGNAFSELSGGSASESQSAPTATRTASTETSSTNSSNTSRTLILVAAGAAAALLCAIGYVIIRDARRRAPATEEVYMEPRRGNDPAVRRQNSRAKAKAAKAQRKRNRA